MPPPPEGALAGLALERESHGGGSQGGSLCRRCMLPPFSPRDAMSPRPFGPSLLSPVPACPSVSHLPARSHVSHRWGRISLTGFPEVPGVPTPCARVGGASGHFGGECGHLPAVPPHVPSTASVSAEETSSQHHDRLLLAVKPPWPQMLQPPRKSRAGFCLRTSWRLRERRHMPGEGTPAKGGKGGSSWA